jgi:hypothetical protein
MSLFWPRVPLREQDYAAIAVINWQVLPERQVVAVAEAWQASMDTDVLARDLGIGPGKLRTMIGRLRQAGVELRPAVPRSLKVRTELALAAPPPPEPAPKPQLPQPSRAALALAEIDPIVRRALEEREAYA